MPLKQCYYCNGSINYSFCDKMRALNMELPEQACNLLISEITIMEQELVELRKEVDILKNEHLDMDKKT